MNKLAKVVETIEEQNWVVTIRGNYFCLENWSPAGEDLVMEDSFETEDKVGELLKYIEGEYENFDTDEHVELWIESRGKNGVPSSIAALVEDAKDIKEMLEKLNSSLDKYRI